MKKTISRGLLFLSVSMLAAHASADTVASGGQGIGVMAYAGAGVNTAVAVFMMKKCNPSNPLFCAMGASAALQAIGDMAGSHNGEAVTAATVETGVAGSSTPGVQTVDPGKAAQLAAEDAAIIATAAGKGVTLSGDGSTVTMPDGSTQSTSGLGSDDSLKDAGLSDSDISQLKSDAAAVAAKAKSQYSVASMATSDGGGGALNRGSNGGGDEGDSKLKSLLSALNKNNRKPASMSGLSKKLGNTGESIGVAGDDIFQMVTRQYQRKDAQNTFLKTP